MNNSDDNQQIATQAKHGSNDHPANREYIWTKRLPTATRTRHEGVACNNQDAGYDENTTAGNKEEMRTVIHLDIV